MSGKLVRMQDQPWHNKKLEDQKAKTVIIGNPKIQPGVIVVVEAPTEVEVSNESPAEVVKPTVKKKTRRTKLQMKAAKDENVQATD